MHVSVTTLFEDGKRLSAYSIRTQVPAVGWLHLEICDYGGIRPGQCRARLLREDGHDMLPWLEHARLVTCRGRSGALIEGVQYRKKGRKHSIADVQRWWCEAPPRTQPLIDHQARVLAATREFERLSAQDW